MKDLQKLFEQSLSEVKKAGIPYGNIVSVSIDTRSKKRWGYCKYADKSRKRFIIKISASLLTDDIEDDAVIGTIVHEILHTCDGCMNHGPKWKHYADIMTYMAKGRYKVTRTASNEELGVEFDPTEFKYVIKCSKCGTMFGYQKMCDTIRACKLSMVKCKCGGRYQLIENNHISV